MPRNQVVWEKTIDNGTIELVYNLKNTSPDDLQRYGFRRDNEQAPVEILLMFATKTGANSFLNEVTIGTGVFFMPVNNFERVEIPCADGTSIFGLSSKHDGAKQRILREIDVRYSTPRHIDDEINEFIAGGPTCCTRLVRFLGLS